MMNRIIIGDALESLKQVPDETVDCCVTSPPYYGLRDYGVAGQIGLEETPDEYIDRLVDIFREVRRALKPDGTLNTASDTTAGGGKLSKIVFKKTNVLTTLKPKDANCTEPTATTVPTSSGANRTNRKKPAGHP